MDNEDTIIKFAVTNTNPIGSSDEVIVAPIAANFPAEQPENTQPQGVTTKLGYNFYDLRGGGGKRR